MQQIHDILFLGETKIKPNLLFATLNRLGFFLFLSNSSHGIKRRFGVSLDNENEPILLDSHHISCMVFMDPSPSLGKIIIIFGMSF
jgi:hypothetical protein